MSKSLQSLLSVIIALSFSLQIKAQDTLFTMPDTVCAGHLITPRLIDPEVGNNYDWSFCSPQFMSDPTAVNYDTFMMNLTPTDLTIGKDSTRFFGFLINEQGPSLIYWNFKFGIQELPIATSWDDMNNTLPKSPGGLFLVKDDIYYLFVIGGSNTSNTSLVRYEFANGLRFGVTDTVVIGSLEGALQVSKKLFIAKEGNDWIGFTFNKGNELVRLNFGTSLRNTPSATNLGNIDGQFGEVSGINGLRETNNWYLHITDRITNKIAKLTFGSSLNNIPFVVNYGNFSGRINTPTGIAITPNCREYYGFVLNHLGSSITRNYWSASIADTPSVVNNLGNFGSMVQPQAMSQFVSDSGALFLFVANSDSSVTRLKFAACGSASYPGSSLQHPVPFSYSEPGTYSVFLTIDQGTPNVRSSCKNITITAAPEVQYTNDTLICQGDTVRLHALFNTPGSLTWSPEYNISSTRDQVIKVWPDHTTDYVSTIHFAGNCILVDTNTVTVSKISADAGADRAFSDGSTAVLGGPNTTIGEGYSYRWWPGDYIVGSMFEPYTRALPGQSITYYLEVRNEDGCYAIDSVNITVSCDEITLPNAFMPGSKNPKTSTFGIMNLQLVKLNFFRIYDRWGKMVFQTDNVNSRWDGIVEGVEAPPGVYVYEVDGFCIGQNRLRKTGNVTLLR